MGWWGYAKRQELIFDVVRIQSGAQTLTSGAQTLTSGAQTLSGAQTAPPQPLPSLPGPPETACFLFFF